MTLKAVFLDVGDTLLREDPSRFEIYARAARGCGVTIEAEEMGHLMRLAHRELPRELEGAFRYSDPWFEAYIERIFHGHLGLSTGEAEAVSVELFSLFESGRTFRLFPGAIELLAELATRGMVIGVVSNWSARLPRLLGRLGLAERVDFVLCSAIERVEKPDPAIFHAALERAGVAPQEALHAGDHPEKDALGAAGVGIEAVLVDHRGRLGPGPYDGFARVDGLPELLAHILSRLP